MVSPIDYTIDVATPFQTAMQGWAMGTQDKLARADEARRQQMFDQQQEAIKQQQLQQQVRNEDLYKFSLIPNKTADDYASIISRYPDLAEPYQKSWGMLNSERQQQTLSTASQVFESLRNGAPNVAKDILGEQIKAYENTGMKREASNLKSIYGLIDKNPAVAQANLGMLMASVAPDQFKSITEGRISLESLPSQIAKTNAETGKITAETQGQVIENRYKPQQIQTGINQTQSQTALNYATIQNMAEQRQLDRDKLETETSLKLQELNPSNIKLSDGAQKLVNDNMIGSVASEQAASQQLDLANRIQAAGGGAGRFSSWNEKLKELTGNQDSLTNLRNEYTRIRNSQAIKMLPPGPATDKDIELAMKGFPPETADSKTIAAFLRGMAKMNQRDAAYKQMQAEWVNQVGNLGSAKRDVEVLGVKVPAGTTFNGYATKNIGKAMKTQSNQAVQRQIATGQRSYMSAVQ